MKWISAIVIFLFYVGTGIAQNPEIESEIKRLEQMEVQAVLEKDSLTLLKLWGDDFEVNAPHNEIEFAGVTTLDRPVLKMPRKGFSRDVEQVIIRGDVVFSMGKETVLDAENQPSYYRRYTNIWMKRNGNWKLVARHANVICPDN